MESRCLLSADIIDFGAIVGGSFTDAATDLGSFHVKSKATAKGTVGVDATDELYKVTVTEPINLKLTLSKLKQQDELKVLFADGTPISEGWTSGKAATLKVEQRLDAGVYYVDVSHGYRSQQDGYGAAKVKKYNIKPTDGFTLAVAGIKPDETVVAPQQPVYQSKFSAAFGATGAIAEPAISPQLAAESGFFQYSDFSGSPLWSPTGPQGDDVIQGGIGDCYFMAVISNIARTNPGLIAQSIIPQANSNYVVRFMLNGQEYTQQIDAKLPVNASGNLIFARQPASGAIWVALLEKAFCFYRPSSNNPGSYDGIDLGYSSEPLKGFGSTDAGDIGPSQYRTAPQLVADIAARLQQGQTLEFGTSNPRNWTSEQPLPSGLFTGHMYSIISADVANNTLSLRNPWATNTRGNPNDGSGGHITVNGDLALQSMGCLSFGTVPIVQTTIDPTPEPEPTPTPTITDGIAERLGVDSFQTDGGDNFDVFTFTATTTGEASVLVDTTAFVPQLLVAEVYESGELNVISTDENALSANTAFVRFSAVAGTTYEIGVFAGGTADTGNYKLKLSNNLTNLTQLSPATNVAENLGSLSGIVYEDENANGTLDSSEVGSTGWTVYLDADNDGTLDTGEASTLTDVNGEYIFGDLQPGTYTVRVVQESGWTQTQPAGVNFGWVGTVTAGENTEFSPFGEVFASGTLTGFVYDDADASFTRGPSEAGLLNWIVYLDLGNNGHYVSGDPYVYTDAAGQYTFTGLESGTYIVRVYPVNGWETTEGETGWAPVAISGTVVNGGSFGQF
ncbi:C2 family cysteine protease [Humisphaera borealis]|uniref:Calpain catalytic domain-containing protein n=1 Tax=Humisphaera borealis TaxID=2807512 RepID=A0A7M2WTT4_9BACT|nr:C2 family cysteine protease [Humisphaera borealis]QOV88562.1 hypothetical protein IPV69_20300 [Humisphaera borealis]